MTTIGDLFMQSKGKPVEYQNTKIYLWDEFPVSDGDELLINIESVNGKVPQGVSILIEGYCEIKGKLWKKGKTIKPLFWADSEVLDPKKIKIKVFTKKGFVWIQNICETEYSYILSDETGKPITITKKKTDGGHNGAAMIVGTIAGGRRYKCSDVFSAPKPFPFNDIVFTVRRCNEGCPLPTLGDLQ